MGVEQTARNDRSVAKCSLTLVLFACTILVGCDSKAPSPEDRSAGDEETVSAVATVGMVADLVRNVGGEHVSVTQIMGAGVDPHLYKATRDDVQTLMQGDIIFYSGLMLEGKMTDTLIKLARSTPVVAVTEEIANSKLLEPAGFSGHYDPHLWMDVAAWAACVDVVAGSLARFDPVHAEQYYNNAAAYKDELDALHEYGLEAIASIPDDSRVLITSHDAFNYFGRAYGIEVQGVQGLSTESEAGLQRINELVDLLVDRQIRAVFVESSVPEKNVLSLVEGARARGHNVVVGGELFSDAMGPSGSYVGTYIGMLDHNITLVARELGGQAPQGGFRGRLSVGG